LSVLPVVYQLIDIVAEGVVVRSYSEKYWGDGLLNGMSLWGLGRAFSVEEHSPIVQLPSKPWNTE